MKILPFFSFVLFTFFLFDSQASADGHKGNLDEIGERIKRAVKSGKISEKEGWSKWHSVAREHGHDDNDEGWNEEGDEIELLHREIELHELRFELDRIKERAVNSSAVSNRKGEAKRECLPCESKDEENNEIERLHREIEIRKLHFELDRIEHEHDLERNEWEHQFERMERDFDRERREWDMEHFQWNMRRKQMEMQMRGGVPRRGARPSHPHGGSPRPDMHRGGSPRGMMPPMGRGPGQGQDRGAKVCPDSRGKSDCDKKKGKSECGKGRAKSDCKKGKDACAKKECSKTSDCKKSESCSQKSSSSCGKDKKSCSDKKEDCSKKKKK